MRRRPTRLTALAAAALACAAAAAPAARAADPQPAPPAQTAGLLDGLDQTLAALLGTADQQQLETLLAALGSGQAPTGALLGPVHDLLYRVADTQGLPPETAGLVRQIADLLGSAPAGEPLSPALLSQLAALLRDVGAGSGTPPALAGLLDDLADVLDGDGGADALSGVLALPPEVIDRVADVLTRLQDGDQPTGALLAPVVDLLRQVAGTSSLPAREAQLVREVADAVEATSGALDPLLAGQVARTLDTVANTPGLTTRERTIVERTATLVGQNGGAASATGTTGRAATKADRAVVKRVRVNRARTRIGVRVACPSSAPAPCATTVSARLGGRKAAAAKRVRIAAGRSKVVRLRMVRAARAASARSGGTLRVQVVTAFGSRRFTATKAVRLKARNRR